MKKTLVPLAALGVLALGACGTTTGQTGHPSEAAKAAPAAPSAPAQPDTNKRGNVALGVGETHTLKNASGQPVMKVTMTGFQTEQCSDEMASSESATVATFEFQTNGNFVASDYTGPNPAGMKFYDKSSGQTVSAEESIFCLADSDVSGIGSALSPNSNYTGKVAFEDAPEHGGLIWLGTQPSLEWDF